MKTSKSELVCKSILPHISVLRGSDVAVEIDEHSVLSRTFACIQGHKETITFRTVGELTQAITT